MKKHKKPAFYLAVGAVLAIIVAQVSAGKQTRVGSAMMDDEAGLDRSVDQLNVSEDMGSTVREFDPIPQGEFLEPPPERTEPYEYEYQLPEAGKR